MSGGLPSVWNDWPRTLCCSDSSSSFKTILKPTFSKTVSNLSVFSTAVSVSGLFVFLVCVCVYMCVCVCAGVCVWVHLCLPLCVCVWGGCKCVSVACACEVPWIALPLHVEDGHCTKFLYYHYYHNESGLSSEAPLYQFSPATPNWSWSSNTLRRLLHKCNQTPSLTWTVCNTKNNVKTKSNTHHKETQTKCEYNKSEKQKHLKVVVSYDWKWWGEKILKHGPLANLFIIYTI